MTNHALYSLRTEGDEFRITKFVDGDVESSYTCTQFECTCPAGHRASCRHRQMIPDMLAHGIINTHWFYNFDLRRVVDFNGMLKSNYDAVIAWDEKRAQEERDAMNELAVTEGVRHIPDSAVEVLPPESTITIRTQLPKASWRRL